MQNYTDIENLNNGKKRTLLITHQEEHKELENVLKSGNFTPIVMSCNAQRKLIEGFDKIKVSINMTKASKILKIPVSTIHDSFKKLCQTNKVEFVLLINDSPVARVESKYDKYR